MEQKSDTRNEIFKRNETSYELESEKNPSFEEMRKQISEQTKKPEENIKVYNIKGNFGSKQFKIDAYVYDSVDDLEKAKQKTQKQRKAEKEESKKEAEEKPAEEPQEAPAEEKKEEAPGPVVEEDKGSEETSESAADETPVEDKPEEEKKEVEEEKQAEEESKE